MKKIFSLFLAVLLLGTRISLAFADGEPLEYNWADAQSYVGDSILSDGTFWDIDEVDASFWLPSIFTPVELTDEDRADGTIGFYSGADGYVLLYYSDYENLTLEIFYNYFIENGYNVELITVNGLPAILQREEDANQLILSLQTQEGKFLQFLFSPLSSEVIFTPVIASIQPHIEETTEEEPVIPTNPVSGLISK